MVQINIIYICKKKKTHFKSCSFEDNSVQNKLPCNDTVFGFMQEL